MGGQWLGIMDLLGSLGRVSGGGDSGVVALLGLVGGMTGYQHHHGAGIARRDEGIVGWRLYGDRSRG